MRIGFIISELRNGGGTYQLLHLALELKKKNHAVYIYTAKDSVSSMDPNLTKGIIVRSLKAPVEVETRRHRQLAGFVLYLWYLLKLSFALSNMADQDGLDLINPHEWPMQWAAVLVKFRKKIPVVWMCNDVWQIASYRQYQETRMVFRIADRTIIPLVDKILTHFVDTIVVLDRRIKGIVNNYYHKNPVVVRSGVDLEVFKEILAQGLSRSKTKLPGNSFIFLCFSIFLSHRRFEDAIAAFNKLLKTAKNKKLLLVIAGSDLYEKDSTKSIKGLIAKLKLENRVIVKTGYFSQREKDLLLLSCDVFVFPNEKQTWGIVVAEAMAAGKPCIVSDEAGVHEIIKDNKNGMIFKVRDINDLYKKMEMLFKDRALREKLGKNAKEYVFANLSWEKYADSMLELFEKVL